MSSPHFKPESSALVLIDLQIGTIQMIKNIMPETAIRNAVLLGKAAQAYKMPIVMTSSLEEKVQGPLHPALQQAMPTAYAARVKRSGIVNAWADPAFVKAIEATGRRQLIMAAVTTDICLVFPAISAVEAGYEVLAVMDACGTDTEIGEDMARRRMERAGVWLTATNTMVAELVQDWSTPQGGPLVVAMTSASPMLPVTWARA
jgi:nicotinamidase-related amidase